MRVLAIQHAEVEPMGLWEEVLRQKGITIEYVRPYGGQKVPESLEGVGALIVLGGPMNVYETEEYPFLLTEEALIQRALKEEVPLLGVCLGAQLLAKACGAAVKKAPEKEIGFYSIHLTSEGKGDAVFRGFGEHFTAFQWHGDTFDLPAGSHFLVTSDGVRNQAFKMGKWAYGLQFHLEVTEALIKEWMEVYEDELASFFGPSFEPEKFIQEARKQLPRLNQLARQLMDNFFRGTPSP